MFCGGSRCVGLSFGSLIGSGEPQQLLLVAPLTYLTLSVTCLGCAWLFLCSLSNCTFLPFFLPKASPTFSLAFTISSLCQALLDAQHLGLQYCW